MIFVLLDEPTLLVLDGVAEANREIEPDIAAEGDFTFFDAQGRPLAPVFPAPPDRRFLGMRIDDDPGPYDLRPAPPGAANLLAATAARPDLRLEPNGWFSSLDEVRHHVATAESRPPAS